MSFVIEDKPVGTPSLVDEAAAVLAEMKVGQSFLVPGVIGNKVRQRAVKLVPKRFKTITEGVHMRIGRVA